MFFMLKLVLIFLLNKTHAHTTQDIERILLPALNTTEIKEIPLTLKVFGKQIKLNLRRNDKNVSSNYEAAYRTFKPFLGEDKETLRMLILVYVNRIQAVFHHPSLGVSIDISLVHLEIMDEQPLNLPVFGGNDDKLLDSFCDYAATRNPPDDNDPNHWDVSLYLTGINIYSTEEDDLGSIGISNVDSVCDSNESCVIVEFGIPDKLSSGFSSSLTAAHEIGHVRGIAEELWYEKDCLRDQTRPKCLSDTSLDHSRYHDLPGRKWTAKAQCEIYFRDKNANVVSLFDICKTLECETPHDNLYAFTGPALEGTYCAPGKECRGGECAPVIEPPYIFENCEDDNWSEWKESTCQSICLEKSKGNLTFKLAPKFELGWQAAHDFEKPWIACIVHCQQKDSSTIDALRLKMLNLNINPYFPDGTWCHEKDGQDYYCRQHFCLPESYS
nr:PREDICTED: A disintegrin and metalloproteinase with thrombospondin motifs 4-like [Linepithema humile]